MNIKNKNVVVTGGGNGIGAALCLAFAQAGAKTIAVVDLEKDSAERVASDLHKQFSIATFALACDVSCEQDVIAVVNKITEECGQIDIFCSNAGVSFGDAPADQLKNADATSASNDQWMTSWGVNVMAHVYAARALLPQFKQRGDGYFVNTASAAGLLNQVGEAAYSATKHAAVSFAESLSITHGDQGIKVSVVCPQAVATRMIGFSEDGFGGNAVDGVLTPQLVADIVLKGIEKEDFLILPHPEVQTYINRKTQDRKRWVEGMRRFRRAMFGL
jgi:NAD(P)-dependent dehydrogenase (short-subunit alcohol dehydrogenase family)